MSDPVFDTVFILPDADTMMKRLKEVDDEEYLVDRFYPRLTKYAGQEKAPSGVLLMLLLAIQDFCEGMPSVILATMQMNVDRWIDALVPDETMAAKVKEFYAAASKKREPD